MRVKFEIEKVIESIGGQKEIILMSATADVYGEMRVGFCKNQTEEFKPGQCYYVDFVRVETK